MRVVVTGASGFVGSRLAECLREDNALGRPISKLVLSDLARHGAHERGGGEWLCGDLADDAYLDTLFGEPVDVFFHIASVPGSAAEANPERGWSANLRAPVSIADRLARQGRQTGRAPRVIFASTIAVYGKLGAKPVGEDQVVRPELSYGAHKLMTEILLADLSRRGEIDARSLRLPGIVARPAQESGHGSAFMSLLFHKAAAGDAYTCPVSPEATCWWMSRETCVANLVHAARLDSASLPPSRTWQLPALHASVGDIVAAIARRFGANSTAEIRFESDARIESLFGRNPPLATPRALAAGFISDADLDTLVVNVCDHLADPQTVS